MNGSVDSGGRALMDVELRPTPNAAPVTVRVWIDTGFAGDLVLPRTLVESHGLRQSGTVSAVLADGSDVALRTYTSFLNWFDRIERLQVVANEGEHPLLGVGLLLNREPRIDYRSNLVTIE